MKISISRGREIIYNGNFLKLNALKKREGGYFGQRGKKKTVYSLVRLWGTLRLSWPQTSLILLPVKEKFPR